MSETIYTDTDDVMSEEEANRVMSDLQDQQEELPTQDTSDGFDDELENTEDQEIDMEVLKNARLRLQQGRLYELLLSHNLFSEVDAEPRVVAKVEREVRSFIKERLEVLVGLKPDPKLAPVQPLGGLFSEEELLVLKEFVGKVSQKVSKPSQVGFTPPKPQASLKPASMPNSNVRVSPVKQKSQQASPVQKQATKDEPRLTKAPSSMTKEELLEHNRIVAQRQASRKAAAPKKKIPMPDEAQILTHYSNRVNTDSTQSLVGLIMKNMGRTLSPIETVSNDYSDDSNDSRI